MLKLSTFPRFSSEQQSKAKMAAEIEELKRDYEDKLKEVTWHEKTKKTKAISDAKTPKETVRRFQKSVNKRARHKDSKNVGGVCSKIL